MAVLAAVVDIVVQRFSSSILACKKGRQLQPSSAVDDLQQNMACYAALNKIWVTMGDCLECKEQSSFNLIGTLTGTLWPSPGLPGCPERGQRSCFEAGVQ
jgi:hypothetical protein